jgi:hypothetical protein
VGIKKYKSVIKEYQKKYTAEIEPTNGLQYNPSELFKKFLSSWPLGKDLGKDELLMIYWMNEAVHMRADVKKEDLDAIIEGKSIPSKEELMEKVKA